MEGRKKKRRKKKRERKRKKVSDERGGENAIFSVFSAAFSLPRFNTNTNVHKIYVDITRGEIYRIGE